MFATYQPFFQRHSLPKGSHVHPPSASLAFVRFDGVMSRDTVRGRSRACNLGLALFVLSALLAGAGFVAAENVRRLTGAQIRVGFVGMQLTDEVHYRLVYERDGTLRSVAMGVKKRGKWSIQKNQLCLYLQEPDDGCYDVARSGNTFTLTPAGLGSPMDGILQPISDSK